MLLRPPTGHACDRFLGVSCSICSFASSHSTSMASITFPPRPAHIPPLPARHNSIPWPDGVQKAYGIISSAYDGSNQLLRLEDGDPIRLRAHSERITRRVLPVLRALTGELQDNRWSCVSMAAFDSLVSELNYAASTLDQVYVTIITSLTCCDGKAEQPSLQHAR